MPAYVVAYAYTDFLQFSGPLQTGLRAAFGLQGRRVPRGAQHGRRGAGCSPSSLYPYVYLLARTALSERAAHLMEAARLLGAPLSRRIREVALPLARPAVAAGVALALMETLADFGVSSYFGIQTFTAGIYKAWLSMDNRMAAAQLATMLLVVVAVLLRLEHRAQQRMRFATGRGARAGVAEPQPVQLRGGARGAGLGGLRAADCCWALCCRCCSCCARWSPTGTILPWDQFAQWSLNSVRLAGLSAVLATALALGLAFAVRRQPDALTRGVVQLASLGYAVPGAVIVVGLLLPVGWLQAAAPQTGVGYWVTATVLGMVWAYLVRFCAVALQSVQSGYARIPASFDDSARMLGTTGAGLLARVHWPLLRRSTAAARCWCLWT